MNPGLQYQHIFFDLDHTLWDFETNSKITLQRVFDQHDLASKTGVDFDFFHQKYKIHNQFYWNQYTQGLIAQDQLRWARMNHTLSDFGLPPDETLAKTLSKNYLDLLPESAQLFPYTKEILTYLKNKGYQLHILSNGFEEVQQKKLLYSGIHTFFDQIITSETCQFVKPNKEIFDYALSKSGAIRETSIMIGDNPDADIQGAINANLHCIYVDFQDQPSPIPATYSVNTLKEIENWL